MVSCPWKPPYSATIQKIVVWTDFLAAATAMTTDNIIKSYPPPIFRACTNIRDEYAIRTPIEMNILKNMEPLFPDVFFSTTGYTVAKPDFVLLRRNDKWELPLLAIEVKTKWSL